MWLDSVLSWFSVDMGIDLGTCNTLVCVRGEGIVLNEPSVVAVKKGTNQVLNNGQAVGWMAKEMLGKTPGLDHGDPPAQGRRDLRLRDHGGDAVSTSSARCTGRGRLLVGPRVVIAVPSGITAVEKQAVIALGRAGGRAAGVPDRGAHGRGDRCGAAVRRGDRDA